MELPPRLRHPTSSLLAAVLLLLHLSCGSQVDRIQELGPTGRIKVGAEQTARYLPLLQGKRVGVIGNQTSRIGSVHLVDSLLSLGVDIRRVFAPEHGFRGAAGAGETIRDGRDEPTGLPVASLYGAHKKPQASLLGDLDVLVFDIQDVGARFYTYISTLHYVMEATAEQGKLLVVLDRPNPNGFYVDGPVLDPAFQSFVGMHPIPVVHGCTVGELAQMINGEGWLKGGIRCALEVIPCEGYTHDSLYELPVAPSPNLPNMSAVYAYPSLCFFEGTPVSVGRGTDLPFQCMGYPGYTGGTYRFVPADRKGIAMDPPHEGRECRGHEVGEFSSFYFRSSRRLYLHWLTGMFATYSGPGDFFSEPAFFDKLAGSSALREMMLSGATEEAIRASWQPGLERYRSMRARYLLYPDFTE